MATSFQFDTTSTTNTSSVLPETSVYGVSDVLGRGPSNRVDEEMTKGHPLESRLANWENSQLNMKLHMQRKIYGLHAPMRTMMEIQSVKQGSPFGLGGSRASRIQLDILMGRDETIDVADIFDDSEVAEMPDVHKVLAGRMNL
ncbi:hypothetical protein LPJ66_004788 [Kickxella alabastrina]|uniref:Uncharacterized protein n=1 Tax=Kickxella alabastrina TaxID=61397 RepID=A0ACC1IND7_9FUNG|nr:hypothetical protein LPJ66_004788 [Kickxella alabastrina]